MSARVVHPFRTLRGDGETLLEIKRSRFLALAIPVRDEEAAHDMLARVRKTHPEANHHCFAFRLGVGGEIGRFSDDGEPGGTAGRPIMEVLLREAVVDALVVVTRYFGGVLLGSGGLTRAYSQAAAEAVRAAGTLAMQPHTEMQVRVDYGTLGALEQLLQRDGLEATERTFAERVTLTVPVPSGEEAAFVARIADLSAGAALAVPGRVVYLPRYT
jgi:uncharacterized YigZ family protein